MFYRILPWFYSQVLSFDKQDELDEEGGEIRVIRLHELKAEFTAGNIQTYPDFDSDKLLILTTDWSALNIAGVLSHKHEGVERFIGIL